MARINPEIVRAEREKRGWSIDDVARKSGIDRQSIHRIEKGSKKRNRGDVIKALARAFGISEDLLTGTVAPTSPVKELDELDELFLESQLNLRVSNRARNALSLAASRYGVTYAQIIEIAPLLFCWAAENSLNRRRERLATIARNSVELQQIAVLHLHARAFNNYRAEETLEAERRSIEANDIFGRLIDGNQFDSYLPEDYSEAKDNPFATFLCDLVKGMGDLADFGEWDPNYSPEYTICRSKVVEYVAGDTEAADEILDGSVSLHKLPKELREKGKGEARAKWVRDEAAARQKKISERIKLSDLGL